MYTPHTVTLYNGIRSASSLSTEYNVTILRNVFLDISKGANVIKSGLESADAATLFIPFAVEAVNAATGEAQQYVLPKEYAQAADRSGLWTIQPGGAAGSSMCFFAKGEVVELNADFQTVNGNHDDVFRVSSVDVRDFGSSAMQHWEVGGR